MIAIRFEDSILAVTDSQNPVINCRAANLTSLRDSGDESINIAMLFFSAGSGWISGQHA